MLRAAEVVLRGGCAELSYDFMSTVESLYPIFETRDSLDDHLHTLLQVDRSKDGKDPDDGFIVRDQKMRNHIGELYDPKDVFMYRPDLWSRHYCDTLPPRVLDRLRSYWNPLRTVHGKCDRIHREFCLALGEVSGERELFDQLSHRDHSEFAGSKLRLLRYREPRETDPAKVGKFHTDRCAITYHLAQNHPGLVGPDNELVDVRPDKIRIFPSDQLQVVTSGRIPAWRHGARYVEPYPPGGRRMAVYFARFFKGQNDRGI